MVLYCTGLVHICRRHRVGLCTDNRAELIILQGSLRDQRQIIGAGVMAVIRHAAGAVEMRIHTAHRSELLIFHIIEVLERAAADIDANLCRDVIRGFQHHAVKHVTESEGLADSRVEIRAAADHIIDGLLSHRDLVVQVSVLEGHIARHDLRDRCRRKRLLKVLAHKNRARIRVHHAQAGRIRGILSRLRPSLDGIGDIKRRVPDAGSRSRSCCR